MNYCSQWLNFKKSQSTPLWQSVSSTEPLLLPFLLHKLLNIDATIGIRRDSLRLSDHNIKLNWFHLSLEIDVLSELETHLPSISYFLVLKQYTVAD